jgi:hypothetical protein
VEEQQRPAPVAPEGFQAQQRFIPHRAPALSARLPGRDTERGRLPSDQAWARGLYLNHLLHRRKQAGGKWP